MSLYVTLWHYPTGPRFWDSFVTLATCAISELKFFASPVGAAHTKGEAVRVPGIAPESEPIRLGGYTAGRSRMVRSVRARFRTLMLARSNRARVTIYFSYLRE